jgi:pyruvate/2-oxoglutarate dehydrogenase complex dihydrolipoamide acyltransferase (E2) component
VKDFIQQHNLVVAASEESKPVQTQVAAATPPPLPSSTQQASASTTNRTIIQNEDREIDYEDIEISNIRKVIAKRLLFSKTTIPHSYATSTCVIDKVIELRKEMIKNNQKVSINDFIIKAISLSLRLVPELNSNYDEATGNFKQISTVDISVAVATDKGLITPIVKNADRLSVLEISENVKVSIFFKYLLS